jgi:hypothetical protein
MYSVAYTEPPAPFQAQCYDCYDLVMNKPRTMVRNKVC